MTETQKINWKRLSVEAAAIVGSILLAFAIDAWWQDREERGEEQVLLEALHAEFRANEEFLASFSDSVTAASQGIGAVSQMTEAELASAMSDEILDWIRRPFTAELQVGTIEGALGTERVGLIRSSELRSALGRYQALRAEMGEIESVLLRLSADAYVAHGMLPGSHGELTALSAAKSGYWEAYHGYLMQLLDQTRTVAKLIKWELS
jgi:hypothetical protein